LSSRDLLVADVFFEAEKEEIILVVEYMRFGCALGVLVLTALRSGQVCAVPVAPVRYADIIKPRVLSSNTAAAGSAANY